MNIPIKELLAANNRIIIPNFGAFVVKQGTDFKVIFNEYLKFNDGLLINLIVEKEGSSKEDAEKKIKDFVDEISQTLDAGASFVFEGLGQISKDSKGRKVFEQLGNDVPSKAVTPTYEIPPIEHVAEKETVIADVIDKPATDEVESLSIDLKKVEDSTSTVIPLVIPPDVQETNSPMENKIEKDDRESILPELDETEVQKEVARKVEKAQSKDASKNQKAEKERLILAEKEKKEEEKKATIAEKEKEKQRILAEKEQAKIDKQAKKLMGEEHKEEDKKPKDKKPTPPPRQKKKSKAGLIILIIAAIIIIGGGSFVALKWEMVMDLLNVGSNLTKIETTHEKENTDHFGTKKHSKTKKKNAALTDSAETIKATDTAANPTHTTDSKAEKEAEIKKEQAKTEDKSVKETAKKSETKVEVKTEKAPTTFSNNTSGNYHIVVGAFQTEVNANKYISKLSPKGLNARILRKRGSLYIVVSSSHATNQEASAALKKYKSEVDPNAWMLKD